MVQVAIHVYPAGEEKIHDLDGVTCWCDPAFQDADGQTVQSYDAQIVVHNAFDGRK
jgi:hypothetical protein